MVQPKLLLHALEQDFTLNLINNKVPKILKPLKEHMKDLVLAIIVTPP